MDLTQQQVRDRLGEPARVTEEVDFLNLHLHYRHLVISFSDEAIASVYSESPHACTPAGLCPGDPLDRAVSIYGAPIPMDRGTGVVYWVYPTRFACFLQIAPDEGKVGSIRAACGP